MPCRSPPKSSASPNAPERGLATFTMAPQPRPGIMHIAPYVGGEARIRRYRKADPARLEREARSGRAPLPSRPFIRRPARSTDTPTAPPPPCGPPSGRRMGSTRSASSVALGRTSVDAAAARLCRTG